MPRSLGDGHLECLRGISLLLGFAAALALPTGAEGGVPFPYRDLILVTAFGVAAFQRVEEELDWADLDWAQFLRATAQ